MAPQFLWLFRLVNDIKPVKIKVKIILILVNKNCLFNNKCPEILRGDYKSQTKITVYNNLFDKMPDFF